MDITIILVLLVFVLLLIESFFVPHKKLKKMVLTKLEHVKRVHDFIMNIFSKTK